MGNESGKYDSAAIQKGIDMIYTFYDRMEDALEALRQIDTNGLSGRFQKTLEKNLNEDFDNIMKWRYEVTCCADVLAAKKHAISK